MRASLTTRCVYNGPASSLVGSRFRNNAAWPLRENIDSHLSKQSAQVLARRNQNRITRQLLLRALIIPMGIRIDCISLGVCGGRRNNNGRFGLLRKA